jgi:hypothetical protein
MRRLLCALTAGLLLAAGAHADQPSLFDPRVTLDVADAPLNDVLEQVSAQTGLAFDTPFRDLDRRMQQAQQEAGQPRQPMPDLAAVRERANPPITLQVADAPVADVLDEVSRQAGFTFRFDGGVTWRIAGPQRPGQAAEPGPQTVAGEHLVSLAALRLERSHEIVYGEPGFNRANDRLSLTLRVEAPSELGRYAVAGLEPGAEAELDGQLLTSALPPDIAPPMVPLREMGRAGIGYQLEFMLPDVPGVFLDRVTGSLSVLTDLRELVFEFESLGPQAQRQTDGDVDVTISQFPAVEDRERSRRREAGQVLELTVSRPGSGLVEALTRNRGRQDRGLVEFDGFLGGVAPNRVVEVQDGRVLLNQRGFAGRTELAPALLPKVACQTADGALHQAELREVSVRSLADRVELSCRVVLDEGWAEPRLWVAVLDGSGQTTPLPFAIGDVPIPAAELDPLVVAPPPPPMR